jgi:protein-S-isoprenylcysteine O-methyltransferase Ste14
MSIHFLGAGARTFRHNPALDEGGQQAEFLFTVAILIPAGLAVFYRIQLLNGVVSLVLAIVALLLYEWARRTVRSRGLSVIRSESVAESVVSTGPYEYIRHPFYASYLLGSVAVLVAFPVVIAALGLVANIAYFSLAARREERNLMESALAPAYTEYRNRTGMFFPRKRKD